MFTEFAAARMICSTFKHVRNSHIIVHIILQYRTAKEMTYQELKKPILIDPLKSRKPVSHILFGISSITRCFCENGGEGMLVWVCCLFWEFGGFFNVYYFHGKSRLSKQQEAIFLSLTLGPGGPVSPAGPLGPGMPSAPLTPLLPFTLRVERPGRPGKPGAPIQKHQS